MFLASKAKIQTTKIKLFPKLKFFPEKLQQKQATNLSIVATISIQAITARSNNSNINIAQRMLKSTRRDKLQKPPPLRLVSTEFTRNCLVAINQM